MIFFNNKTKTNKKIYNFFNLLQRFGMKHCAFIFDERKKKEAKRIREILCHHEQNLK
jgi:predicted nucleic acid-binding OB-fold protein